MMDRRLLILAVGMFALGTDSFVVAGLLRRIEVRATADDERLAQGPDTTRDGEGQ